MPTWSPRPSQMLKMVAIGVFIFAFWVGLGFLLSKIPYAIDYMNESVQDYLPSCGLRKQPLPHYIHDKTIRIMWEGRCPDQESKLFFRFNNTGDFDSPSGYEYSQLDVKRHLFSANIVNVPSNTVISYYVVYGNGRKTKIYEFTTLDEHNQIRLGLIGDSQLGVGQFKRLLKQLRRHQPMGFIHLGDMVQHAHHLRDWQTLLFAPLWSVLFKDRLIPSIFTSGNHDWFAKRPNFYLHDRERTFFALTIAECKLIVLDSERQVQDQVAFLEEELANSQKHAFRIVIIHVPPWIEFWSRKDWMRGDKTWPLWVRRHVTPLLKKYNVDILISGHQHNYQRGYRDGMVHVISGGGGGLLDRERVEEYGMYKVTKIAHHYMVMTLSRKRITLSAYSDTNVELDSITLEKKTAKRYQQETHKI